ncbi:MAG TPA: hypothetical protein PLT82_11205 [Candidatus Hydrogenedens sp.]|nr:hypothetical protein [Candidatus Hydrogenedens sp.]HOK09983.1 hypothetical protein [Candidatus Hydrogenedens sp.]HOL19682.1 hypothetical protein [Candidatus Hydrogenedens sp.]HPP59690.1 hypothetical protein [Candidatus Hydrogenedens sp.]
MVFGDIGGTYTELIITCSTPSTGTVSIHRGDALKLTGDYEVSNAFAGEDVIFGQAMSDCDTNESAIPVKVRGVCIFDYQGTPPTVDGLKGIVGASVPGKVKAPATGNGFGRVIKVEPATSRVHVLL